MCLEQMPPHGPHSVTNLEASVPQPSIPHPQEESKHYDTLVPPAFLDCYEILKRQFQISNTQYFEDWILRDLDLYDRVHYYLTVIVKSGCIQVTLDCTKQLSP
ncbi:hypothetical protein AAZV13_15G217800 [Glycine max]